MKPRDILVATHGHCFDGLASAALFTRLLRALSPGEDMHFRYRSCGYGPGMQTIPEKWLDGDEKIQLIDVREPNEYEIVSIPGATLIPKGEFISGAALEKLPQDKRIVLHCKSGARSAEALAVVKNAGFTDAVHVGGGVLAWINQVDPSLPSY